MIIELLLDALYGIFSLLTSVINIPALPDSVSSFLNDAFSYISAGVGILANYTDFSYLLVLLGLIIAIDIGVAVYHFVMWVIRKIPVASIS